MTPGKKNLNVTLNNNDKKHGERGIYDGNYINKYKILTASPLVNNEGRRKNAPARESNPGPLVYETSALTIEPRDLYG